MRLRGKTALVTGGRQGIGRGIVEAFLREGAKVTTCGRGAVPGDLPEGCGWVQADVADPTQVSAMIEQLGPLDILVNNAGVQVEKTVTESTDDDWDLLIGANCRGVFNCCRAAVRQMATQDTGGSIINIGSIAGNLADHQMAVYNASKGAVHALTRAIATDNGRQGVRCNAISPGWIMTALADAAFDLADDPAAARAAATAKHPVGRMGDPADIAGLAVYLASAESGFVSGSCFTIDGGLTAQSPITPD